MADTVANDEALRDNITLNSGMTLEKDGVVRMLTAEELVVLWRRMQK